MNSIFTGVATALITPTDENGVNYNQLNRLIDWQLDQGVDALVLCGTTGEACTLSREERRRVIAHGVQRVNGRVPVIAGTGTNDTAQAVELARQACRDGADALLVSTPYYNKATQNGLISMYGVIADAATRPVILYNVPSRTGIDIEPGTFEALAGHGNIAAIKEAGGNLSKTVETMARVAGRLDLYSGNDDQIVPLLALGGIGCISVLSNVLPARTRELCTRFFSGDTAGAAALQLELIELISALFCEVNPIPVKAALAAMGYCDDHLRLPLTPMEPPHRERLLRAMAAQGVAL